MPTKFFAAFVHRAGAWDPALPPQEQAGFPDHAKFVGELEASGFIAMAGLMQPSSDVLFVFRAESEAAIRERLAHDGIASTVYIHLIKTAKHLRGKAAGMEQQ